MYLTHFILAGMFVAAFGSIDSMFFQTNGNCTGPNDFVCRNSRCVPKTKRCDGANDCFDSSDEEDCDIFHCKAPNFFRCKNNVCVSASFVCDEEDDCGDFSDEADCAAFKLSLSQPANCSKGEWQCSDRLCVPEEFVCNGNLDCLDGSDETLGCTRTLKCDDGFRCQNMHCIPHEWRCDGTNDCQDNTDELNCDSYVDPRQCTFDDRLFLCRNNHTCIALSKVCDHKPHCPDGSDEGVLCTSSRFSCSNHHCSHDCAPLPQGPKCMCPKGYRMINDKDCLDINECEKYGICDQKCRNTPGSYECYCDPKYVLQEDKTTCKAVSGEAMMVFSSKTEIRGYFLESKLYFPIAENLRQVVGVGFDGNHIYWTDIYTEHEAIVKAKEDGSQRELIVTSGLGAPEDLAVDWVTGNVYFTDSEMQHIGVCTNDGNHCTVLVNEDMRKPRGIVLNPFAGEMYWSDWGHPAKIGRSRMDGTDAVAFVSNNIAWPNGLALDYPNERLYWADAKSARLESVRLDGTDRRIVMEGIVKHPYAVAIFENRLFWSDWHTHSVDSCDKFTGKNHHTLIKDKHEYIYGIHIFHSSLKQQVKDPCITALCSDICLLNGNGYTCACPEDKILSPDKHTCKATAKQQVLMLGTKDLLIRIEHQLLGKHETTAFPTTAKDIGSLAYNSANNTLFIGDLGASSLLSMSLTTGEVETLLVQEQFDALAYDYLGNNLYWCDSKKETVEMLNLNTMSRKILLHDMAGEVPTSLAVVPDEGVMFVSFKRKFNQGYHIDRFGMDGTGRTHVIDEGLLGPLALHYEFQLHRVFWADAGTGNIESTSVEGDDRHGFRSLQTGPIALASLSKDLFWTNQNSRRLFWADKHNTGNGLNKKITLDLPGDTSVMRIVSVTPRPVPPHPCQQKNGNCSHLCLPTQNGAGRCACPLGMNLSPDNATCFKPKRCGSDEFFCRESNVCIPKEMACNGLKNCEFGEDELDCAKRNLCAEEEFQCKDGSCIERSAVCDMHYDCSDKSDESVCTEKSYQNKCQANQFRCSSGMCISRHFVCDGLKDCHGGEDELNCLSTTCAPEQFRCSSGSCIPKHWECDHEYDCSDFSDEHPGCVSTCAPHEFTCKNGRCIDGDLKCDKVDDCGDMSDELTCRQSGVLDGCTLEEFRCPGNKTVCLPEVAVCNGTSECPQGEDELHCSKCYDDEFQCDNKKCLPKVWLCDGADDCGDGSDELRMTCMVKHSSVPKAKTVLPCAHGFRCKSGHCIEIDLVCNGEENCYDGSDEYGACNSSCRANSNPCAHKCVKTPSGPMCACHAGYKLQGDGQSCADIEECSADPPVCSQTCTEQAGSFQCDCHQEFVLRSDKKSCKSKGGAMSLIFAVNNQIRQLSRANNSLGVLYSDDSPAISGLDVLTPSDFVYFSIEESGTIHRINLKTYNREYITRVGRPQKLAIDWITQNVYFVNVDGPDVTMSVCNFHQQLCSNLFSVGLHVQVSAIAIDAVNKHVFYATTTWWIFNSPRSVIYRRNLDGNKLYEVVKSASGHVTGLACDVHTKKLYYVDQHHGQIDRVGYDGAKPTSLFGNLSRPFGLSLFEDHLYFLTGNGHVGKCRLFGEERICDQFRLNAYANVFFTIAQISRQPIAKNVCQDRNCTYMCVPTDVEGRCLCEDGKFAQEGQQCETDTRVGGSTEEKRAKFQTHINTVEKSALERRSSGSMVAGVLIPVFLLLGAAIAYIFIRRRNTGKFNISMRFYNPMFGMPVNNNNEPQAPVLYPGEHEYTNPIDFSSQDMQATTDAILQKVNPLVKIE